MSLYSIQDTTLTDIADAIRSKTGKTASMTPAGMVDEIESISGGGSSTLITKAITENGTYSAEDDDADGYSSVTVNVPTGITPTGTLNITENDTYDVTNYASAVVNVSGGTSVQTATGTVSGSEAIRLSIPCDFEPDLIYVHGDLTGSASLRGVVSVIIIKDTLAIITCDGSQNNTDEFLYNVKYGITGLNESDSAAIHASYSDGYITIDAVYNTSSCRFNSSVTYAYKFVKWT